MKRACEFSADRRYRYTLWREVPPLLFTDGESRRDEYVMFIGLNPSTADETADDPTIRRCVGFAQRWGYGALCMTNLFAFRATEPAVMKQSAEPVGDDNDDWLAKIAFDAGCIVCAWGNHGEHMDRDAAVKRILASRKLCCLRVTSTGAPEHPLYVPYETRLRRLH